MIRVCVLFAIVVGGYANTIITHGTTLLQTFLIHRHGDRTPVESTVFLTTDPEAVIAATEPYGYGQLTDVGRRRSYKLGQFIRERYSSLLSPQYNKSEIYIRSTDSTRTKMTILTALAAIYPAYPGSWSEEVNWVPVPYTTVPAKYDFNLANLNCPTFMSAFYERIQSGTPDLEEYDDVMDFIFKTLGSRTSMGSGALPYAFYDAFASQISLGVPVSDEIIDIMPRLSEAAAISATFVFANDTIDLLAGVLLNEFFVHTSSLIAGVDTPRVRIYSAHDSNVLALMTAAKISPSQGVPKYASTFALELRRVETTGQYVVLAVFKPDPSEELVYLDIAGCGKLCDLEQFQEIVSKNLLDEDTWRTSCGFSEDLVVDDSSIN